MLEIGSHRCGNGKFWVRICQNDGQILQNKHWRSKAVKNYNPEPKDAKNDTFDLIEVPKVTH